MKSTNLDVVGLSSSELQASKSLQKSVLSMAEVSVEYLAYMHDLISLYHEKLSQILSPTVAETFRDSVSDLIVKKLGITEDQVLGLEDGLRKWGVESQIVDIGEST
jgi:lipase chaperone LimK